METMDSKYPTHEELRSLAQDLIVGQSTMTLATAQKNVSWAAPVYYASIGFKFYFFSDPKSRHIQECTESDQASAAIFFPASTWQEIRGIQMSGRIHPLSIGLESFQALRAYLKKYPFTKDFFDSDQQMNLDDFVKRFKVKLYRFQPALLYYSDNKIRFGFRERVPL
jgi:uncharacterized protein YhbP (UPF0306 family)